MLPNYSSPWLLRTQPEKLLRFACGNNNGDLIAIRDGGLQNRRPAIRRREIRLSLQLKAQRGHRPRDDHKRIRARDAQ